MRKCLVCGNVNPSKIVAMEDHEKCTCCGETLIELVEPGSNCTDDIELDQSIF